MEKRILNALTKNGPMLATALREKLGVESSELRPALRKLRAAGKVRSKGNTRGTLWSMPPTKKVSA